MTSELLAHCRAKEGATGGGIIFERSLAFNRDAAGIVGFLQVVKKVSVVIVLGKIVRPYSSVRIREMQMYDLPLCDLEDFRILVLFSQMVIVNNHANVEMLY